MNGWISDPHCIWIPTYFYPQKIISFEINYISEPSDVFKKPLTILEGSPVSPSDDLKEVEAAEPETEVKPQDPLNRFNIRFGNANNRWSDLRANKIH